MPCICIGMNQLYSNLKKVDFFMGARFDLSVIHMKSKREQSEQRPHYKILI